MYFKFIYVNFYCVVVDGGGKEESEFWLGGFFFSVFDYFNVFNWVEIFFI